MTTIIPLHAAPDDLMDVAQAVGVVPDKPDFADLPVPYLLTAEALQVIEACELCGDGGLATIYNFFLGTQITVTCPLCRGDR